MNSIEMRKPRLRLTIRLLIIDVAMVALCLTVGRGDLEKLSGCADHPSCTASSAMIDVP
jgi:hypothetical protein